MTQSFSLLSTLGETVFRDKHEDDYRVPYYVFKTPLGGSWGILIPSVSFWYQIITTFAIQLLLAFVTSGLVYTLIIGKRTRNNKLNISAHLVGYGLVIPICLFYPFHVHAALNVRNKLLRFTLCAVPVSSLFRCLEAMYGFSPPGVESSYWNYFRYYAFPLEIKFDAKSKEAVKVNRVDVLRTLKNFAVTYLEMIVLLSFLAPYDYEPFDAPSQLEIANLFHPGRLMNNFIAAVVIQHYLATFTPGITLLANLVTGAQIHDVMHNPMFASTSPSEFWGRRWNTAVHGLLKRGVYKPVRSMSFPPAVAATAAFIASGLFHEWLLIAVFSPGRGMIEENQPIQYGKQLAFFCWNAIVLLSEYVLGGTQVIQWMRKNLPMPVISSLVVLTVLPIAHWFTDDYVKRNYFHDGQVAFPLFIRLSTQGQYK